MANYTGLAGRGATASTVSTSSISPNDQSAETDLARRPGERLAWLAAIQRADHESLVNHLPANRRPSKAAITAVAATVTTKAVDGSGRCWASLASIAESAGVARSTVQAVLALLVRAGWLTSERRRVAGSNESDTSIYELRRPRPIPVAGTPIAEPDDAIPESQAKVYRTPVTNISELKNLSKAGAREAVPSERQKLALLWRDSLPWDERKRLATEYAAGPQGYRPFNHPLLWLDAWMAAGCPS